MFQVKLDTLYELQRLEHQKNDWLHAYYVWIKEELQNTVIQIKSHSNRIQVREAMQYVDKYYDKATWVALSPLMVKEAKIHLSHLLDSGLGSDYLAENGDSPVIKKIHNLEPITNDDLQELERILWHELGTEQEYAKTTNIGNILNSQQQEFVWTVINYVRENGDVELSDLVDTEPFNNYDLNEMFGINLPTVVYVVKKLHESILVAT